jgi:polyhydroxyalkanoate synthase subunit PhaC
MQSGADSRGFPDLGARIADTLSKLRRAASVEVGCSLKRAVWSCGKTTLYRYLPLPGPDTAVRAAKHARPILICFALVNRPYILDLQPDRSLIRRLLEAGHTVYLVDWGDAGDSERCTDLEDYLQRHLAGCVAHVLQAHGLPALDLLGVCQGGVLSLCYTALHPRQIANLVTLTTPVDFHTADNLLSKWVRGLDVDLVCATGNVPGEVLNALFLSLSPVRLAQHKYVRLLASGADQRAVEDFVRMEKWIFDSPPQAAAALAQFVRWFYQENRLAHDTLEIGGRAVKLREIRQPVLNLYATQDHIVPPAAAAAMEHCIGSEDYESLAIDTGHIGMYVSRTAREKIPGRITSWLQARS